MQLTLELTEPGEPKRLVCVGLPANIGRADDSGLILQDAQVSSHHASLHADGNSVVVRDEGSANGVWRDDERLAELAWVVGGSIRVGQTRLHMVGMSSETSLVLHLHHADGSHHRLIARLPCRVGLDEHGALTNDPASIVAHNALLSQRDGTLRIASYEPSERAWVPRWRTSTADRPIRVGDVRIEAIHSAPSVVHSTELGFDDDGSVRPAHTLAPVDPSFPPDFFHAPVVSLDALRGSGVPVIESRYLGLGAGLGSFCWVDALRVHGVPASDICVVGFEAVPYSRYARLCKQSQIPDHERLRSNSESCPDNLWGFPGYAAREAWREAGRGRVDRALALMWQISAEPDQGSTYTPRAGDVFRSIDAEATRIGWDGMVSRGRIRRLRKTDDGRFVVAVTSRTDATSPTAFYVAQTVHVALGYPGVQFLPDLRRYREQSLDFYRVVNAYEDHDHIYTHLEEKGGTVLLRGRGIVASRVLQRLDEARRRNKNVRVVHLMRSENRHGNQAGLAGRNVENHWEFQPFNWPEACWGGDLERVLVKASGTERRQLMKTWGGTTTAPRADWLRIIRTGLKRGWYRIEFGSVGELDDVDGRLLVTVDSDEETRPFPVDFVIDATGLVADPTRNPVWHDLIATYELPLNGDQRIAVEAGFEVSTLRNGPGRVFAAGVATLGGPYAPVDSFLGLQYAALAAIGHTASVGTLRPLASLRGWIRWVQGVAP